ncbi:glycoside hydrolase family 88 protein [Snuella sedimenti]|uniref:Glycoside hydrolase family 88 protein n=1 Tax=Snuella sedimenti TaxID=2798802 RepID=A0A8J7IFS5_9FLAO|nr:glycoside hydrolase family 88 protein [Snuella sedimenti]MBJ6368252.1 glycoside hydrolase family 88 protein [Snuella sedimenti]
MSVVKYCILISLLTAFVYSLTQKNESKNKNLHRDVMDVTPILEKAEKQLILQKLSAEKINRIPRTVTETGEIHWANSDFDWTEGFFPGSCWFIYESTKNEDWKVAAEKFQDLFETHKYITTNHDLGFVFNCSFGNGYRLTENEVFKQVLIEAANSLSTRFNSSVGCLKSWDVNNGWQSKRNWKFPVIIDNMMNLELLFKVSEITGNPKYKKIAITHANTTLANHFRENNSSYHVVDYDPKTGDVRSRQTAQGFADGSSWARGQAWGLYGYTVCYRYTKDMTYLEQAQKIAKYILHNNAIPKDGIPFWDYDADNIPNEPRDVSAAAITLSALIELDEYTSQSYLPTINKLIKSLASNDYTSPIGENQNFILMHSVGSIPHNAEIDVPLNYADYYYLEALVRYQNRYHIN